MAQSAVVRQSLPVDRYADDFTEGVRGGALAGGIITGLAKLVFTAQSFTSVQSGANGRGIVLTTDVGNSAAGYVWARRLEGLFALGKLEYVDWLVSFSSVSFVLAMGIKKMGDATSASTQSIGFRLGNGSTSYDGRVKTTDDTAANAKLVSTGVVPTVGLHRFRIRYAQDNNIIFYIDNMDAPVATLTTASGMFAATDVFFPWLLFSTTSSNDGAAKSLTLMEFVAKLKG